MRGSRRRSRGFGSKTDAAGGHGHLYWDRAVTESIRLEAVGTKMRPGAGRAQARRASCHPEHERPRSYGAGPPGHGVCVTISGSGP